MEGLLYPLWRRARSGLGYVPQTPSVVPAMSVEDNVALGQREPDRECLEAILERFGLVSYGYSLAVS